MQDPTTAGDTQPEGTQRQPSARTTAAAHAIAKVLQDHQQPATPNVMLAAIEIAKVLSGFQRPAPPKLTLSAEEVAAAIGVGERTFHAETRNRPDFPRPVTLSDAGRIVRWRTSDVAAWLQARDDLAAAQPEPVQLRAGKLKAKADKLLAEAQKVRGRVFRSGVQQSTKTEAASA